MFSYYGSKSKIVHLYPRPRHNLIIEPFAGSARYALRYFDRDVILIDKCQFIIDIWHYLQSASAKDILALPELKPGDNLKNFNLSKGEKLLLGFLVQRGVARPGLTYSGWRDTNHSPTVADDLQRIAANLFKIKHWQIKLGDYTSAPSAEATWFIDPPYFVGGHKYKYSNKDLDFEALSCWVKSRKGQVIVCENASAEWMPFLGLTQMQGLRNPSSEVFWTNEKVEVQASLF